MVKRSLVPMFLCKTLLQRARKRTKPIVLLATYLLQQDLDRNSVLGIIQKSSLISGDKLAPAARYNCEHKSLREKLTLAKKEGDVQEISAVHNNTFFRALNLLQFLFSIFIHIFSSKTRSSCCRENRKILLTLPVFFVCFFLLCWNSDSKNSFVSCP